MQPDISKFSSELLPLLFACLAKTSHDCGMSRKDIIRTYYAVEMFCENLGLYFIYTFLIIYDLI